MDELVCYVPGNRQLIDMKHDSKSDTYKPIYKVDPISQEYAALVGEGMVRAMNEILSPLIDGQEIGRAIPEVGGHWGIK